MQFTVAGGTGSRVNFFLERGQTKDRVVANIRLIKNKGERGKDLGMGLSVVRKRVFNPTVGDRPAIPNVLVVITDEVSNTHITGIMLEANKMKDSGTSIISIGVSNAVCRPFTFIQ